MWVRVSNLLAHLPIKYTDRKKVFVSGKPFQPSLMFVGEPTKQSFILQALGVRLNESF
jgi:hypothetical protein